MIVFSSNVHLRAVALPKLPTVQMQMLLCHTYPTASSLPPLRLLQPQHRLVQNGLLLDALSGTQGAVAG